MAETFYDVLGVDTDADESAIDDAFRERIKEVHPDVSDDPGAEERSRKLIEAKEVLTDESERARYDRLGHDQYVRQADTDAGWTTDTSTRSPSEAATEWTETDSDASGTAESTWSGRGDWRHRRRRGHGSRRARGRRSADNARTENGDQARSASGNQTRSVGDAADRTAERSDGSAASAATSSGETQTSAGVGTSGNVGGSVGWATGGSYAVRNDPSRTGVARSRLFPPTQSVVLLVAAFFSYPGLVFSSVFPGFSPIVNVIVTACTLALIVYLASIPEVGIYVFGGWTVLGTFVVLASTIDPLSPVGLLVLGVTWLPLGLTVLTYWALRW